MLKPADYTRWRRKSIWHLDEAVALMLGIDPNQPIQKYDGTLYSDYWDMLDTTKRSSGIDLPTIGRTVVTSAFVQYAKVRPNDFLKWAVGKGYDIPNELSDILEFDAQHGDKGGAAEEQLDPRERTTLLQIIAVLAAAAELDLTKHSKAAETLQAMGAQHALELPKKKDTIADKLKQARDLPKTQ